MGDINTANFLMFSFFYSRVKGRSVKHKGAKAQEKEIIRRRGFLWLKFLLPSPALFFLFFFFKDCVKMFAIENVR